MKIELYRVGQTDMFSEVCSISIKEDKIEAYRVDLPKMTFTIKEWDLIRIDGERLDELEHRQNQLISFHIGRMERDCEIVADVIKLADEFLSAGYEYLDNLSLYQTEVKRKQEINHLKHHYRNLSHYLKYSYGKRTWEKTWAEKHS